MELYGTEQAAEYLGMTIHAFRYHIHVAKDVDGRLIGKSWVFTQEQLDRFKQEKRPPGRPKKTI